MNIKNHKTTFGAGLTALAFSTILTTSTHAQTCTTVPTCDELGYDLSAEDCTGKRALKCPFDKTKYFCQNDDENGDIGHCDNPSIGDILYSDMSCSADVVSGKTPIAVVFNVEKRLAIGLKTEEKSWMDNPYEDVDTLSNESDVDWHGRENTKLVVAFCKARGKSCPAFEYVNTYTTDGTKAGDWFLPAYEELASICTYKSTLNAVLLKIGGTIFPNDMHWASSEAGAYAAWMRQFDNCKSYNGGKPAGCYVRPVLQF